MNLLTIGIPAFERPELLSLCLEKAIEASKGYDVSFLVCDDSTEKVNEVVVQKFINNGINIRYISNKECLGIDENIKKCFDEALSHYVWVIGEDDHVMPSAIENFFNRSASDLPEIFLMNYVYCSNDYTRDLSKPLINFNGEINRLNILREFYKFGFIGAIVFSKKSWSKYSPNAPVGTFFHHLSVLGKLIFSQNKPKISFIDQINIRNRAESGSSATWVSEALSVHFGYYDAINYFKSNLNNKEWGVILNSSKKLFRPTDVLWLLSKRADGAFNLIEWQKNFAEMKSPKKFLLLLISFFPISLAKSMKFLYFKLIRG